MFTAFTAPHLPRVFVLGGWSCGQPPGKRLQRDCVPGKGCEEHRANAGTPRVMLEAKVPSKRPQDHDRET